MLCFANGRRRVGLKPTSSYRSPTTLGLVNGLNRTAIGRCLLANSIPFWHLLVLRRYLPLLSCKIKVSQETASGVVHQMFRHAQRRTLIVLLSGVGSSRTLSNFRGQPRCRDVLKTNMEPRPNPALNLAPFSRWTLREKSAQRRLALRYISLGARDA